MPQPLVCASGSFGFLYDFTRDGGKQGTYSTGVILPKDYIFGLNVGAVFIPYAGAGAQISIGVAAFPSFIFGPGIPTMSFGGGPYATLTPFAEEDTPLLFTISGGDLTAGKMGFFVFGVKMYV